MGNAIADMSGWGWVDCAARHKKGKTDPLGKPANIARRFKSIDSRPAMAAARRMGTDHAFRKEIDKETRRVLFPSNYPVA